MDIIEVTEEDGQPSSSTSRHIQYDIFLSFRGEDTRTTFTDFLYRELLQKHYSVFRDEEGIQCGENIAPTLEKAIRESMLSVVVLSQDYGSSTSCLNELKLIMECRGEGWHHVVPIFYHVEPYQVRYQECSFAVSFQKHETDESKMNKVEPWKAALREIAELKGIHVEKGKKKEHEIIQETINCIGAKIGLRLETNGGPIQASDLVGQGFQRAKDQILSWLNGDEVAKIGVYGMGGVGKTALMKNIYNQVRDFPICWVTVSQDFSIGKLQNLIAKSVKVDISNVHTLMRAVKLAEVLKRKGKLILILDDLWNYFDEEEVGIPLWPVACKLIFTSRSIDVCNRMKCKENIMKIQPLNKEEAWILFRKEVEWYDDSVEEVAKLITKECGGLPLAIKTMARYMRGVRYPYEWSVVLDELKESTVRNDEDEMESNVFSILRFSYDRLKDSSLQQCFLYCSFFPEDSTIWKDELVNLLISWGIIEQKKYRRDEVYKVYTMLDKLKNLCLLNGWINYHGDEEEEWVRMHDLMRDMALQILRKRSSVMVQTGMQLPAMDEWKEDLEIVSLIENNIWEITSGYSPMCPNLSTLLLSRGRLTFIHDSFFEHFSQLKVLDLSSSCIEKLPDSISDLVRLTALILTNCTSLGHVPSLGKLQELKTLDLGYTGIKQVPRGMELLIKLRYLDMRVLKIKEFPVGMLSNLLHLQTLRVNVVTVKEAVNILKHGCLKNLQCYFPNLDSFNNYIINSQKYEQLHNFNFTVFSDNDFDLYDHYFGQDVILEKSTNTVSLNDDDFGRKCHDLPLGTARLRVYPCEGRRSFFPINNATHLKCIEIFGCRGLECMVSSSSSVGVLEHLEKLQIFDTESLQGLIRMEDEVPPNSPSLYGNAFAHLKIIMVKRCHRMKRLFPQRLLPNLKNLEIIFVSCCFEMEEIIGSEEREETVGEQNRSKRLEIEFSLPK